MPRRTKPKPVTDPQDRGLPKRAFVTGGAGFIGAHVVQRLVEEGVEVTCLCLPQDPATGLQELPHRRVDGDLSDPELLARAMEGAGAVFHLAAIYALWLREPRRMFEVNVQGTRNVLQAARKAGVPLLIHTSSIAAVGVLPGEQVADETTPFNGWEIREDYIWSKYISELEVLQSTVDGLQAVAVNPAFPYGPGDRAPTPTGRIVRDAITGDLPFVVDGGFNAVDVRDVAQGHLLAARRGRPGQRYILGGHNLSYHRFNDEICRVLGRKPPRLRLPTEMAQAYGWLHERWADLVTHQPPPATRASAQYLVGRYLYFSTRKAEAELGYTVRPLAETVEASVRWFERQRLRFGP
jgi:dihydroflavonol-4-reductase